MRSEEKQPDRVHAHVHVTNAPSPPRRSQVADTGIGVPANLVDHLFTTFSQASKYRFGTGLGLYHAYELAKALGGTAWYTHNEPSGAIFIVEVPLVRATEDDSLREVIIHDGGNDGSFSTASCGSFGTATHSSFAASSDVTDIPECSLVP